MDQARHVSLTLRSTRFAFTSILAVTVLMANAVRPADAQTNTALGTGALSHVTTGSENTALGFNALNSTAVGLVNTATGKTPF